MWGGFTPARKPLFGGLPRKPTVRLAPMIYPMGGINAVDAIAALDPRFCTSSYNIVPDGRGGRVRSGYQEFATGLGEDVRSIIPFTAADPSDNKLYAATLDGIYDVTAGGTGPWTEDVAFGTASGEAGYGVYTMYRSDAGTTYGFYADEVNGLFRRPEGGSWAAVTDITGVDEEDLVFVMEFKTSLYFVERGTAAAWYLLGGNIAGAATKFDFGNKFQRGGTLVGLWNWTVDGGDGIDDYLVAVSTAGDVIVYRGTDPTDPNWTQVGQYWIGPVPVGRRIACSSGGELFILSQLGVLPMSRLVSGRPVQEQDIYASRNITPLITDDMAATRTSRGWELRMCTSEQVFILATPKVEGYPFRQYVLSSKTNGWSTYKDLPYVTGDELEGIFYLGGEDGYVYKFTGNQDNVLLADSTGVDIQWGMVSAFSDLGEPGAYHRAQLFRPVFRSTGSPAYVVQARYDYDLDDPDGALIQTTVGGALWDVDLWDAGIWGGAGVTIAQIFGAEGLGRAVAIALLGQSSQETLLIRIDMMFDSGGLL